MSRRSYDGPALDGTYQHISERPALDQDGTVYATDPEPVGEERTEDVPVPDLDSDTEQSDRDTQTTFEDWGWSA